MLINDVIVFFLKLSFILDTNLDQMILEEIFHITSSMVYILVVYKYFIRILLCQ